MVLFFKLGVEQRVREIGLLRAVGLGPRAIRRLFTLEGVLLAVIGSVIGMAAAVGYAWVLMTLLTTRWIDAVGTTALRLHVSGLWLAAGAVGGVALRWRVSGGRFAGCDVFPSGACSPVKIGVDAIGPRSPRPMRMAAAAFALAGLSLAALGAMGVVAPGAAFFGAGALLLVAALTFAALLLRRPSRGPIGSMSQLAARNAGYRPGRSVLAMAVIASATFILVTVDAFRRDSRIDTGNHANGTGGYELLVRTLLPMVHDPNSPDGRDAMNLFDLDRATRIEPLRVRPGDDASCLNLYQPTNPTHSGATGFVPRRRTLCLPGERRGDRRGAREPVADLASRARRRGDSGHRRRQLDDVRPASSGR